MASRISKRNAMNKIVSVQKSVEIAIGLRKKKKKIVLVGGVFDILHLGHVKFLEKAKEEGDFLLVLLESDESVKKRKGNERPINSQTDRAEVLSALEDVDFVITLKGLLKHKDYDRIVKLIEPSVLATTAKDPNIIHKQRQAKLVKTKVKIVIKRINSKSTSKILKK